ncbi:hypothetical protein F4781DRAFT_216030 [Annulohypoxylon bovei var. microspora]|nr:hypothetical protein F4781DRAFT_216030 [Annulohypoxylon bovei var. microspora]
MSNHKTNNNNRPEKSNRRSILKIFRQKQLALAHDSEESSKPSEGQVFWPRDFLARDLPEARIWTYGYNADVIGGLFQSNNQNSISQHGRDFTTKIQRDIENEEPIVFIAHSLGGLLVKDAIARSNSLRLRTRSIIFLGTPHRGSSYAGWAMIASNIASLALQDANEKILKALDVDSEVLDNIHEKFIDVVATSTIKIYSFQEAHGMSGTKILNAKVVDDYSSKLGLHSELETVQSIDANHRDMARCKDRYDPQYRDILSVLRHITRDTLPMINGPALDATSPHSKQETVGKDENTIFKHETNVASHAVLTKTQYYLYSTAKRGASSFFKACMPYHMKTAKIETPDV